MKYGVGRHKNCNVLNHFGGIRVNEDLGVGLKNNLSKKLLSSIAQMRTITISLVIMYIIVVLFFSLLSPHFFKANNFKSIITNLGTVGLVVVGESVVILAGGFDLSVGSIVGLQSLILIGFLDMSQPLALPVILFFLIIFGSALGGVNGIIITKVGINPIITTLGTMAIFRGFSYIYVEQVAYVENPYFLQIGKGYFLNAIPYTIVYIIVSMIVMTFVLKYTRFGRSMYLTGANAYSARLVGINTNYVKFFTYIISGIMSTLASIVLTSQVAMWRPGFGMGYELEVITAAVLGGVSLEGGQGDLLSVFLAILILATISNGLVLTDVNIYYRMVIKGILLIVVVAIDALRSAKRERG